MFRSWRKYQNTTQLIMKGDIFSSTDLKFRNYIIVNIISITTTINFTSNFNCSVLQVLQVFSVVTFDSFLNTLFGSWFLQIFQLMQTPKIWKCIYIPYLCLTQHEHKGNCFIVWRVAVSMLISCRGHVTSGCTPPRVLNGRLITTHNKNRTL
jgi:hypothetical protein